MDWRIQCGGPTAEELHTIIAAGNGEASHSQEEARRPITSAGELEMIDQIQSTWLCRINEFYDVQLRERFIVTSGISALKWDRIRDRVIFIHDKLTAADLAEHLEQYLYSTSDSDAEPDFEDEEYDRICDDLAEQLKTESARVVFSESVTRQTTPERHTQLGTVSEPVEADVWQAPEFDTGE